MSTIPASGETTQDLVDPNSTAVLTSQISQESAADLEPSGIPGTASNAPNAPPAGAAANQDKTDQTTDGIHSESKTFAVSRTTHHLIEPPGRIKRLAAAVLVDDVVEAKDDGGKTVETRRKRTPDEMKQIEDLAKASLGFDATRGDQISVEEVAFQIPQVEAPVAPTLPDRVRVITERYTGLLRYAALLVLFMLVYFLLLSPVKKRVLAAIKATEVRITTGRPQGPALAAGSAGAAALPTGFGNEAALPEGTSDATADFTRALALKQQIVGKVKTDPENASRLVQNWVREPGARA